MKPNQQDTGDAASRVTRTLRELLPYTQLGWQMVATVLLALGAGYLMDRWLGTKPVFLVVGMVAGIGAAIVEFIRTAQTLVGTKRNTRKPRNP
jgi:F0F1-type ATP synthase assembly protein I